ncbi:MAG: recombinase family protein [Methanomicrobiales archaeon]|nr:recombinase family protein [Methanomicrobiales archaeon]MDI6875552.1 recombinase family protein [Methanomicrobiales archaeon]
MKKDAIVYLNTRKRGEYEEQLAAVQKYARYRFNIHKIFHDHRSKSAPSERELYREMLKYAADTNVESVILHSIPEFSRNLDLALEEIKKLTHAGHVVYFADQNFIGHMDEPQKRREAILEFVSFMELYQTAAKKSAPARPKQNRKTGKSIGRPKALDPGQMEALLTVRRAGTSIGQICKMFNVSRSTVSKILADYPDLKGEWKGNKTSAP